MLAMLDHLVREGFVKASNLDLLCVADSPAELSFLEFLSDHPGAFDCGGPWLGGFRDPQGAWRWTDGSPVQGLYRLAAI